MQSFHATQRIDATQALSALPVAATLARCAAAALAAAAAGPAVASLLQRTPAGLGCGLARWSPAPGARVFVVALGKASPAMAEAALAALDPLPATGLVIAKTPPASPLPLPTLLGGHPLPTPQSLAAAAALRTLLATAGPADLVLLLLSGGASALCAEPAPGLSLADLRWLTKRLMAAGAPIEALNTVRAAADSCKGGGLLHLAPQATWWNLVVSDVVAGPLSAVGSGPALGSPATPAAVAAILDHYGLLAHLSPRVRAALLAERPTPPPTELRAWCIASNRLAQDAVAAAAPADWRVVRLQDPLIGEARQVGVALAHQLIELAKGPGPGLLVAGGETTVTFATPPAGPGGRNQELALAALPILAQAPRTALLALATDGDDGSSGTAGAIATGTGQAQAQALGLDPALALATHAAGPFWHALGADLALGPTGTNVADIVLGVWW